MPNGPYPDLQAMFDEEYAQRQAELARVRAEEAERLAQQPPEFLRLEERPGAIGFEPARQAFKWQEQVAAYGPEQAREFARMEREEELARRKRETAVRKGELEVQKGELEVEQLERLLADEVPAEPLGLKERAALVPTAKEAAAITAGFPELAAELERAIVPERKRKAPIRVTPEGVHTNRPLEPGMEPVPPTPPATRLEQIVAGEGGWRREMKEEQETKFREEVDSTAQGIAEGMFPPEIPGRSAKVHLAVRDALRKRNFDLTNAQKDWRAVQRSIDSGNSPTLYKLQLALSNLEGSVGQAEVLYADWVATGLPTGFSSYNSVALRSAAAMPGEAGVAARTLMSHIEDMANELAVVYKGGGTQTDIGLQSAQRSLGAEWNPEQFKRNLELIRQNLQIRKNSIQNYTPVGMREGSPYWQGFPEEKEELTVLSGSQEEQQARYRALPKGADFIGPDGKRWRKP